MDYEKKYIEALEWARKVMQGKVGFVLDEVLEKFPELKESESEQHRKWILEYLYDGLRKSNEQFKGQFKCAISWLERQSEQKPTDNQFTPEQACVLDKHIDKFLEHKPAEWSEEDEINLGKAIWYVENPAPMVAKDSMLVEWLKNLRGRVQPQPKQEWCEEDERIKDNCISFLGFNKEYSPQAECIDECITWLKSLSPKSHWKPSDAHYELEEFAKIVRCNLTGISKAVQKLFEAKYLQLTGNKMYGGFKD